MPLQLQMGELLPHLQAAHWRKSHRIQTSRLVLCQSLLGNVLKMQIHQALLTQTRKHKALESVFVFIPQ